MQKLFLDTNILARFLLGDVLEQNLEVLEIFKKAKLKQIQLYIIPEVFLELFYVLHKQYELSKIDIIMEYRKVLNLSFLKCENQPTLLQALDILEIENISLEDAYFISYCLTYHFDFFSFDTKANKIFKELTKQ
jgi:predicted nucleic acid-binding protein